MRKEEKSEWHSVVYALDTIYRSKGDGEKRRARHPMYAYIPINECELRRRWKKERIEGKKQNTHTLTQRERYARTLAYIQHKLYARSLLLPPLLLCSTNEYLYMYIHINRYINIQMYTYRGALTHTERGRKT